MGNMDPRLINALVNSPLATIVEFFSITFIILMTYFAVHRIMAHVQSSTKMMLSMLIGTITYSVSKVVVVAFYIDPLIQSTYIRPF